ncbi:MAG: prephenate dehydrogenase [Anaerolineae bacterium]
MPSTRQRITVIGTGCIGASIGMALRLSEDADHLEVVGHDKAPGRARQAKKLGAFDRTAVNLHVALRSAHLVIIAVPLSAMREVFQDVGARLEPDSGVVVTDTGPLKVPAIRWAQDALPKGVHYVGGDPFLAPGVGGWEHLQSVADADPELFEAAVYAVTARAEDHPGAVRTVANLAVVLGATPLFMDPVEHDAVRHRVSTVPGLVATALFGSTVTAPGWAEMRKAAARDFATATAPLAGEVASRRMAALLGREAVLRGIDACQARLSELREAVASGDAERLDSAIADAVEGRVRWLVESASRSWQPAMASTGRESLFDRTIQAISGEGGTRRSRK